jgi:hypothetical protein
VLPRAPDADEAVDFPAHGLVTRARERKLPLPECGNLAR